ncbi:unnamed protein product [Closterium sp. Yama58-4]|nr:unnamed protein product [Closterium sp. Yama58-4]
MGVGRRGGWVDGVLEEAACSVNAFADDGSFLALQLARADVAGRGVGGGESEKRVEVGEEARDADGGKRGAAGERERNAVGIGGAGGRAEGVGAGDGEKGERREGGGGRWKEGCGRGGGDIMGRGRGEGMEGGGGRAGAAAMFADDARVQEIRAEGTANQMAAKAMRLKLMGKAEEADCWQVGGAQVGWAQVRWAQVGWAQVGWARVGWAQVGWAPVGWVQVGWAHVGSAQVGWAQVGWAQVGWAQVGWAQVGWGEWRMRAAAAKSQPPPPAPPPALLAAPATSKLEPRALGEGGVDVQGEAGEGEGEGEGRKEVVQLPLVDGRGRYLPAVMAAREGRDEVQAGRREKRVERYDVEGGTGQLARYFADDDGASLRQLVAAEWAGGAHDLSSWDRRVAAGIGRAGRRYKGPVEVVVEYAWDDGLHAGGGGGGRKKGRASQQQREKAGQVGELRRQAAVQQCINSPALPRHLVLSVAAHSYLMLPPGSSLLPNHVLIVPSEHEGSMRVVEEAVWEEVRNFKKCLTHMAMASEEGARALDEAESELCEQHSKRIIDTRAIRGRLRGAIPPNFPYFHVEFGLQAVELGVPTDKTSSHDHVASSPDRPPSTHLLHIAAHPIPPPPWEGGYWHMIDDESSFKPSFGRDVIAGMMEMDPERFGGRARARGGRGEVGSRLQEV